MNNAIRAALAAIMLTAGTVAEAQGLFPRIRANREARVEARMAARGETPSEYSSTISWCDSEGCHTKTVSSTPTATFQPTVIVEEPTAVVPGSYSGAKTYAVESTAGSYSSGANYMVTAPKGSHGGYGVTAPPERQSNAWLVARASALDSELSQIMGVIQQRMPEEYAKAVAAAKSKTQARYGCEGCKCGGDCDCPDCPCNASRGDVKAEIDEDDPPSTFAPSTMGYRPAIRADSLAYSSGDGKLEAALVYQKRPPLRIDTIAAN